ncbi:hypothetical protein PACTADRAFT_49632 [Pachysolen tannophilus NRRL Y-2460]|uniref:Coatomer subunit gamma n=1 Tax=Pachysolen tannophilus NRRL Y-2460 TaxID=669874 RepID=A0A1E4TWX0_PACTA|nr:hypothetical protein PACTADRAFT_49632 [Pachysolen tannophilus NRRL Y-2460]
MSTLSYKKFEDIDSGSLPDKMTVFQDCLHAFNTSPVQAKRCRLLLSRLLRLLYLGDSFASQEATTLFFSISKLFQHKDSSLRQMVYLAIKELSVISEDVLMVTSSIMKDIQNGEAIYKPNAIRSLTRIVDASTVHATERLMKNCVVDRNPSITSATLVSSYHLLAVAKDVVKRWTNETQEAISATKTFPPQQFLTHENYGVNKLPSSTYVYQYHALGLLYHLRNHDKMALMKLINQLSNSNSPLRSPLAIVQLIRYIGQIIKDVPSYAQPLFPVLNNWLRNKSDMVELEAAKTILGISSFSSEQHLAAINCLQILLSVPRTVTRFAAVRILNKIAMKTPEKIVICNVELENLINDSNRSVSTYAITTLLKTGNSDNVDRLIKTILKFMNDISDEFKIVVIDAIRTLSLKFPEKYKTMLNFLNDCLRDDGGFVFKNAIVEALFDMIKFVPQSRDLALENLCEFIEDCEFTELAVRILHLLGNEGPKTTNPTLYIRHIYNRVVLENSIVRSSAVIALSKFALIGDESISKSIKILLSRCLNDVDDEVRDRAALSLKLITSFEELSSPDEKEKLKDFISPNTKYSLPVLEQKLSLYMQGDKESFIQSFDIKSVPTISDDEAKAYEFREKTRLLEEEANADVEQNKNRNTNGENNGYGAEDREESNQYIKNTVLQQQYSQELSAIPEFKNYGNLLHSSSVVELTEREIEFVVEVIKHVFEDHLVLQFNIENTLEESELNEVTVVSSPEADELYEEEFIMPIEKLKPQSKGTVYVSFTRPSGIELTSFTNTLSFISKEVDTTTGESFEGDEGFQDEYQIEELSLTPGDFIIPSFTGNFTHQWDELSKIEQSGVYNLSDSNDLQEIVQRLIRVLSMMPVDGSDIVTDSNSTTHVLKLFGKSILNSAKVACIIRLAANSSRGIMMKTQVRGEDEQLCEAIINGVA